MPSFFSNMVHLAHKSRLLTFDLGKDPNKPYTTLITEMMLGVPKNAVFVRAFAINEISAFQHIYRLIVIALVMMSLAEIVIADTIPYSPCWRISASPMDNLVMLSH